MKQVMHIGNLEFLQFVNNSNKPVAKFRIKCFHSWVCASFNNRYLVQCSNCGKVKP